MFTRPPERFLTPRLVLRKPLPDDAPRIFRAYAQDEDVTRYLAWRRHRCALRRLRRQRQGDPGSHHEDVQPIPAGRSGPMTPRVSPLMTRLMLTLLSLVMGGSSAPAQQVRQIAFAEAPALLVRIDAAPPADISKRIPR